MSLKPYKMKIYPDEIKEIVNDLETAKQTIIHMKYYYDPADYISDRIVSIDRTITEIQGYQLYLAHIYEQKEQKDDKED